MVITGKKQIQDYFNQRKLQIKENWKRTFEMMISTNVDLTSLTEPLLDSSFKSMLCNKNIRLVIIDNLEVINVITKGRTHTPDVLIQVWDLEKNKNFILGVTIRKDSDVNWNDEKLPLNKTEKIFTSWVLNSYESEAYGPPIVVEDIVKSISEKKSFYNVFRVLD